MKGVWLILVLILTTTTFGTTYCICTLTTYILFLVGGILAIYYFYEESFNVYINEMGINHAGTEENIYHHLKHIISQKDKETPALNNTDWRLTGSMEVDEQLEAILAFLIRDYFHSWYDKLSNEQELSHEVQLALHKVIVALTNRARELDWLPYLTTELVDDCATHIRLYRQAKHMKLENDSSSLEDLFFDLELKLERNAQCRDQICMDCNQEKYYLQHLAEVVLYLVVPSEEFHCLVLRYLLRDILVNTVLVPIINLLSDPDYVNLTILWLCDDIQIPSDIFLSAVQISDSISELQATNDLLMKEIATLRSKDSGGNDESVIKAQLNSLLYLYQIIQNKIKNANNKIQSRNKLSEDSMVKLPLQFILENNIALSYFIDFLCSIKHQGYIFFYFNIEGWKVSVEQYLNDKKKKDEKRDESIIRESAESIFQQYLGDLSCDNSKEQNSNRLTMIQADCRKQLGQRIQSEVISQHWFDEVHKVLFEILETEFLVRFKADSSYNKMLAELEMLKEDEFVSTESETSSLDYLDLCKEPDTPDCPPAPGGFVYSCPGSPTVTPFDPNDFKLNAEIIETGLVNEKGKSFGIYALAVTKAFRSGEKESWHIYRRYSDFYDLHQRIRDKFTDLGKLTFPAKKTFHNMDRSVLEFRMKMLNEYLEILLHNGLVMSRPGLKSILLNFVEPGEYDKSFNGQVTKTLENLMRNSMRSVGNVVRTMPDNLLNTVDEVMDNISKVFINEENPQANFDNIEKLGTIDIESEDNVPLRIMLRLMNEVFELRSRSQWLRRQLVQILRSVFGDIFNRKILETVEYVTGAQNVATMLLSFRHSFWPHGLKNESFAVRDEAIRDRTKLGARAAILSSLSDEFKHIVGSETSRRGLLLVFSLFQNPVLNKRLVFVILEGILSNLFPKQIQIIRNFHKTSPRVQGNKVETNNGNSR
uniref:Sorting nexin-13 n=1 Tax=Cacopsylla melanoneura TaxID=428564 RepID=A0A8D8TS08_9HEMI